MSDEMKKDNARNKAYTSAMTALREAHREEFDALLGAAYETAGLEPRKRRTPAEIEAEKVAKAAAREAKVAAKRAAKIEALQREIDALKGGVPFTLLEDAEDPMSVFSEA